MKIDEYGQVSISEDEAVTALYSGKIADLQGVYLEDQAVIDQYNQGRKANADAIPELLPLTYDKFSSVELFDKANRLSWFMPDDYCPDLVEHLYSLCETEPQRNRVDQELALFIQYGMFDLLFYLKYLADTMRDNNIVSGVGRGSSVASYCLYLLGVHRIDSLKYGLDIHEFLK